MPTCSPSSLLRWFGRASMPRSPHGSLIQTRPTSSQPIVTRAPLLGPTLRPSNAPLYTSTEKMNLQQLWSETRINPSSPTQITASRLTRPQLFQTRLLSSKKMIKSIRRGSHAACVLRQVVVTASCTRIRPTSYSSERFYVQDLFRTIRSPEEVVLGRIKITRVWLSNTDSIG